MQNGKKIQVLFRLFNQRENDYLNFFLLSAQRPVETN